jgi:hypothetical protein
MVDVPTAGAPTVIAVGHRPAMQGRAAPLVSHLHWLGESIPCAGACLGLLLYRDASFDLLIGVGPHILHMW